MYSLRPANERGHTLTDWLDSFHTFSFGQYYDPQYMGFGDLRVINDDVVAPGKGFDMHPHDNMEIISIVTVKDFKVVIIDKFRPVFGNPLLVPVMIAEFQHAEFQQFFLYYFGRYL